MNKPKQYLILCVCIVLLSFPLSFAEELRILCWDGYAVPEYTQPFEKMIKVKYGIDLTVSVQKLSDPQEFFDGIRGRKADIISPAHNVPKSAQWPFIKGELVLPINLKNIPNYTDLIPLLQKAEYITENGHVYGVPIVYGSYGLMYNTGIIKNAPDSWNIFWDPRYAGKYAISADYHEVNVYITALASGLDKDRIFEYSQVNTPEIIRRVNGLAQNAKTFWVGVDTADVLQGLAFATAWGFARPELARRGEVWKMAHPREGTTGWVDNWMIGYSLKDKPTLKRIAEEWINYSIGPEVQVGYVRNISQFPVNLSIRDRMTPEEIETFHLDDPTYFKKDFILWKTLSRLNQTGLRRIWKRARQSE
ncbi:MAG: extracellular solute-binding protein [Deltaproteobacteria bacterium]|nr:extracellular solute-binding protein [Deltaproteobacteria bacterium]